MNRRIEHMLAFALAFVVLVAGCSGIKPYDPSDYKEEPPGNGLLTGADGEFVVFTKKAEQKTAHEEKKAE